MLSGDLILRIRRFVISLAVPVAILAATSGSAWAVQTHPYLSSFDGSDTPAGSFAGPERIAIDQSGDVLYVLDQGNGSLLKFDISGANPLPADFSALSSPALDGAGAGEADETPQGGLGMTADSDIAVDNSGGAGSGNIYVSSEAGYVYAFADTGALLYVVDGSDPDGPDPLAGTPTGSLDNPCGIAVGDDGSIYVTGYFASAVRKFTPAADAAGYDSDIAVASGSCHIAIDGADNLYAASVLGGSVEKYDAAGSSQGAIDPGPARAVSVNPDDDHVYVDRGGQIAEYDAASAQVSTFGDAVLTSSPGLAVDASTGHVLASDEVSRTIAVFDSLRTLPTVVTGAASAIDQTVATLNGIVDPSGEAVAECEFEWGATTAYGNTVQCAQDPGSGMGAVDVSADLVGLAPGATFHYRLMATNANGETIGEDATFETASPPTVQTMPAAGVTESTAIVGGAINPKGFLTTYYLEYSVNPDFSSSTSIPASRDAEVGDGTGPVHVSRKIAGLSANTRYYFRVVAANTHGIVQGKQLALITPSAHPQTATCPAVRTGLSLKLPACRVYEKITPASKNGGNAKAGTVVDGNHVNLLATASLLPEDPYYKDSGRYIATRTGGGIWGLRPAWVAANTQIADLDRKEFSQDVIAQVCEVCPTLLPGEDTDTTRDVYARDAASLRLISTGSLGGNSQAPAHYAGQSYDGSHILFETKERLEAADSVARDPLAQQLYERVGSSLRVVGLDSDEQPLNEGGAVLGDGATNLDTSAGSSNAVSADGSTIFFESPDPGLGGDHQLYARVAGEDTIEVSASQCEATCGPQQPATFQGASENGSRVYFTTASRLLEADGDGALDLYQYRLGSGELTLVSGDCLTGDGASVDCGWLAAPLPRAEGVIGVSADGRRAYFDAPPTPDGYFGSGQVQNSIWLYDETKDSTEFVAPGLGVPSHGLSSASIGARMTPDGGTLIFQSNLKLTTYDNEGAGTLYRYRASTATLDCISCNPTGDPPSGEVDLQATLASTSTTLSGIAGGSRPNQLISADGRVIVFQTTEALMSNDVNGARDAYVWQDGRLALLGTGTAVGRAEISGVSADGNDIFFTSFDQLVPTDVDGLADLYDARVGGESEVLVPAMPCTEENCQTPGAGGPDRGLPGSSLLAGRGDLVTPRRASFSVGRLTTRQLARLARGDRVWLRVRVSRAGRVIVRARAAVGAPRVVVLGVGEARERGVVKVALRLSAAGRQELARSRRLPMRVTIRFAGRQAVKALTLKLESRG